eukprot:TRINITY_DN34848_c0_g1_i1.p1 TRINITY_DN34848_c0_g1~~TRINITY_DN34848_c0_g1_i1.p1  ORF type:complete len:663 (+),score=107.69 TRINITY_DN34848_c0_g1_i1:81-2069(+)
MSPTAVPEPSSTTAPEPAQAVVQRTEACIPKSVDNSHIFHDEVRGVQTFVAVGGNLPCSHASISDVDPTLSDRRVPGDSSRQSLLQDKENVHDNSENGVVTDDERAALKAHEQWMHMRELDALREQLEHTDRLRIKAEDQAKERRTAVKTATEVSIQMQTKDRLVEELQCRIASLEGANRDAQRRIAAVKEQVSIAAQKKLAEHQACIEAQNRRIQDLETATAEAEQLRLENSVLRGELIDVVEGGRDGAVGISCAAGRLDESDGDSGCRARADVRSAGENRDCCICGGRAVEARRRTIEYLEVRLSELFAEMHSHLEDLRQKIAFNENRLRETQLQARGVDVADAVIGVRSITTAREDSDDAGVAQNSRSVAPERVQVLDVAFPSRSEASSDAVVLSRQLSTRHFPRDQVPLADAEVQVSLHMDGSPAAEQRVVSGKSLSPFSDCSTYLEELEDLRAQNYELALTVQHFKHECDLVESENRSLNETAAIFAGRLEMVEGQNAELIGHANHRQKIKYTMKLKEENAQLRSDVRKARQRAAQLEAICRQGDGFVDLLSQLDSSGNEPNPSHRPTNGFRLPRRTEGLPTQWGTQGETMMRSLERIQLDFGHFLALVERAVSVSDGSRGEGGASPNMSIPKLLLKLRRAASRNSTGSTPQVRSPD